MHLLKSQSPWMKRKRLLACVAASGVLLSACGDSDSQTTVQASSQAPAAPVKAKELSPGMATAWVRAVASRKTEDGSTVSQVLAYVQAKRPSRFKYRPLAGDDDIGYSGATGEPGSVSITYWIGSKRGDGDSYVDLGYDMTPQGQVIAPSGKTTPAILALEGGKQSFLKWIDNAYDEDCRDMETNKLTC
ncbi:hypothetical protein [Burkholderia glumae]|uniref:hypothetical protein n=1 Tax=Burkholderia glumae TaxID=337 RepID=UPI0012949BF6|nr:hypothetical protein [Burkholderia glumae]MCM2552708.1 hypothetical protein [Burkholderia glumae]MCQ0034142.1 hypothetical protein [Burkholderia glumae]MCQ0037411.1 hypothetical protein [Burkholderia glumae]QGA41765.1 hypothetical protein GAS19_30235 [Burkholderia glumae]